MIWFLIATVCVVYFMAVAVYSGLESKFHLIWLGLALLATFFGVLEDQNAKRMIRIPMAGFILIYVLWIAAILLVILLVLRIVKEGRDTSGPGAEYLIVLGAHINGDVVSRALQNRLDTAVRYYRENPDTKLILSGGKGPGEDITEAQAMREYLLQKGVPEESILTEEQSFNTEENIVNCRKLAERDDKKLIIVTNRFHLSRAIRICKKQGITQVEGLPAEDDPIMIPSYYLREVLATLDYQRKKKI
ncbi:MAG: YdcF family protein [Lachnospiraceae bacterium]|nr:YdcF family protein [Lachnospiraceae bacterium]